MLLTVDVDTKAGNETLPKAGADFFGPMMEALKPEAADFVVQDGRRTCLFVLDLADPRKSRRSANRCSSA
jgi:hypothetical protein